MKKIFHFYHVYADGEWKRAADFHMTAMKHSGLWDALDGFYLGLVGSEENCEDVKEYLPGEVIAEERSGWEQVTLEVLQDFCEWEDGHIFYAHTKGAWSNTDLAAVWRESMTYDNVIRWRDIIWRLDSYDGAGAFWLKSAEPEHREHQYFFAGNFWWANASYIRKLPPVGTEHRYQAEGWIGLADDPKMYCLREGLSFWGNFAPPDFKFPLLRAPWK